MSSAGLGRALLGMVVAAGALLAPGAAQAYPQWQFSSGTGRCAQCHYSPAGGGIVTGYARDAAGDDLSTFGGNGAFVHGAIDLPKSVALQFDGRFAALNNDVGEERGPKQYYFPMQADLSARFLLSTEISFVGVFGYRGQARLGDEQYGVGAAEPEGGSQWISREHYLMWRPAALGAYVRVGRFFAPFGLRLAEHNSYVRTDLGFDLLKESYNVSGGWVENGWELHVTAFAPDVLRHSGADETGVAGMYELHVGDAGTVGIQARAGMKSEVNRYTGGAFAKRYVEAVKALFQTELDLTHEIYPSGNGSAQRFDGYASISFFPFKGLWLTPFAERSQTSIAVKDTDTNAAGVQANWFPFAHFELTLQGRVQQAAGKAKATTGLAFLHYYM